jgi:sugar-specific transcriptional regulator TrmB
MNDQLISQIEDLGLSNKEARVYVASLMLGASAVQRIADYAGIKRVTTYVILESLVSLGLVSQSIKGKKTYFSAEEPANLRRLLEKREQDVKEQKTNLEHILPELLGLKTMPTESPAVKFYDSSEGIKSIMATFLASHKDEGISELYGMSNLDQLFGFFPEFRDNASNPNRVSEGIPSKIIYTTTEGPMLYATDKLKSRQSRWVPHDKFPLNGDISIVGDYIIMLALTGSKPIGITIQSHELAQGLLGFFWLSWEAAAQYNQ